MTVLGQLIEDANMPFGRFLALYQQAAAELYEATGEKAYDEPDVTAMTVHRWKVGGVAMPRHPAPSILERMYNLPPKHLFASCTDGPPATLLEPMLDESELLMTARQAAAHAGDAAGNNLPDMTLAELEDDARALARAYLELPPFAVFGRGRDLLAVAQAMLERTQIVAQRARLYLVAGQAAAILATTAFDLGSLPAAVSFARSAAMYGQVIAYGPLQAHAHGTLALLAYWDRRPSQAVELARVAKGFDGLGDTARLRLGVIEARAYAHLGNATEARRAAVGALEVGRGERDELHDDVAGEFGFTRRRALMSNGTTYLLLNDSTNAIRSTEEAIGQMSRPGGGASDLSPQERTDLAQAQADLARAHILAGELDGASEAVTPVFDLPREWRVEGVTDRMRSLRGDLALAGSGQATAELAERIEAYVAVAASAQIGSIPAIGA
ncbi:hypothetical protein OHV05_37000 (plasmid) [Kitasatospora sp. NBC_00070]|uniref:hypothetical protein n=1 Tax=Kitasatospora sp. NBC_00070 TaxID=2975962 RepID=UPI002F912F61